MSDDGMPERLCQCGCGTPVKRNFVRGHHMRLPGAHPAPKPIADRIRESVRKDPITGCWMWLLRLTDEGYPQIKASGRSQSAARVSYEAFQQPLDGLEVQAAACGRRQCVNPEHLEAVTSKERHARGDADPASNFAAVYARRRAATHCPNGHPWDETNTRYQEYNGYSQRACRACQRDTMRQRRTDPRIRAQEAAQWQRYYAENREAIRERERSYYIANAPAIRQRSNTAKRNAYASRRDAGECVRACGQPATPGRVMCSDCQKESSARNWGTRQWDLHDRYDNRGLTECWLCDGDFTDDDPLWHDHLHPRSLGGPDEPWNFAPAHRSCNIRRRNTPLLETLEIWHPDGVDGPVAEMVKEALMRG